MIDTIRLVVHNIEKYKYIYEQFYTANRKRQTVVNAYVEEATGELIEQKMAPFTLYSDSNRFLPFAVRGDINIPSSDYSIRYSFIPSVSGTVALVVEFSIPKYLYSTNVFQFISMPLNTSEALFSKLTKFVIQFFRENFVEVPIMSDIEIKRIDLCYNQFFNTKEDALLYLNAQKKMLSELGKNKDFDSFKPFREAWMLVNPRYSFKCYHKGTEFHKNDYQKLVKFRKQRRNLSFLQVTSDTVLRYEVTFRPQMLNYLFHSRYLVNLGERSSYIINGCMYNKLRKYIRYADNLGKSGRGKGDTDMLNRYISMSKNFLFKSPFNYIDDASLIRCRQVTFELGLFDSLFNFFWEKVRSVQLKTVSSAMEMRRRIIDYSLKQQQLKKAGLKKTGKVDVARLIVPAVLSQYVDVRTLKEVLPASTYYRMLKQLREAGVDERARDLPFAPPRLDYADYILFFGSLQKDGYE